MTPLRVLGLSGSLRKASLNTALLRAAVDLAPAGMTLEPFDLGALPLFNEDLVESPGAWPEPVAALRNAIASADALLLVSPEYNHSIPAVMKNAIDWASRPPASPLGGKPAAILGASPGGFGTVRMQPHLRQVLTALSMLTLGRPEVLVSNAKAKFDANGALVDEPTREAVRALLVALAEWTARLRPKT